MSRASLILIGFVFFGAILVLGGAAIGAWLGGGAGLAVFVPVAIFLLGAFGFGSFLGWRRGMSSSVARQGKDVTSSKT